MSDLSTTESITSIAILAHIDAGKTTLSEQLLFLSKKINTVGFVEEGLSTMDYLLEERRRGITIEAGFSSFRWRDRIINFVDTPGHVDFGVEVDCAIDAIEAAVVVISGVRKVQTQTYSAWHKLEEARVPHIVFINKLDYPECDVDDAIIDLEMAFDIRPLVMSYPYYEDDALLGVVDVISEKLVISKPRARSITLEEVPNSISDHVNKLRKEICEFVAENDELALEAYLGGELTSELIFEVLQQCFAAQSFTPIYCGSARMSAGVRLLANGLRFLTPSFSGHSNPHSDALILKIRNSHHLGRFYLIKAMNELIATEGMQLYHLDAEILESTESVRPGQLAALVSSNTFRIGDEISWTGDVILHGATPNYNPLIEVQMEACVGTNQVKLKTALEFFLESDPSLRVEFNEIVGNWRVCTIGEVQLQVLIARLRDEFGIEVNCGHPEICRKEKWKDIHLEFDHSTAWGTNSLRMDFSIEKYSHQEFEWNYYGRLGNEELVRTVIQSALNDYTHQGVNGMGELINLRFNFSNLIIEGQLLPGMLKKLVIDGLRENLTSKHVDILEPFMDMELVTPEEYSGKITADLKSRNAKIQAIESNGKINCVRCEIPLEETFGYATWLRDISRGRASYGLQYRDHKPLQ